MPPRSRGLMNSDDYQKLPQDFAVLRILLAVLYRAVEDLRERTHSHTGQSCGPPPSCCRP